MFGKSRKSYNKLPEVISLAEFEEILKKTRKFSHRLAFKLAFFCCLRISEVVCLRPDDVDKNRGYIFIRQGKGNKDRYVPIAKPLMKDLKNLPVSSGYRALEKAINRISEKAIGKRICFHTLRHSGATFYLNKNMNIRQLQLLLGHASLASTMIYTHVNPTDLRNKFKEIWK